MTKEGHTEEWRPSKADRAEMKKMRPARRREVELLAAEAFHTDISNIESGMIPSDLPEVIIAELATFLQALKTKGWLPNHYHMDGIAGQLTKLIDDAVTYSVEQDYKKLKGID